MNKISRTIALMGAVAVFACPANAQEAPRGVIVGQHCDPPGPDSIMTAHADDLTAGILQCIPNNLGHYFWEPMGAGIARYDSTWTCTTAGVVRWNGSSIQYCNGSEWVNFNTGNGQLHECGCGKFWCDAGYHIVGFQYSCGCSSDAVWFECQPD